MDRLLTTGVLVGSILSASLAVGCTTVKAAEPDAEAAGASSAVGTSAASAGVRREDASRFLEIYASDKTAEMKYVRQESVFGLENSRASASFLFNEERDNALTASILFDADPEFFPGLKIAFGPKLIAGLLSIENADVIGLAAGLDASYTLPLKKFPLELNAVVNYAPDILTFGQSDRIIDWHVRAAIALTDNIDGFVGVRYLQFDTRPGERELDKKAHLGIRWYFDN